MKKLLLGIVVIVIVGVGGLVYRNAVEHPSRPIACPVDALICPDGTSVARTGSSCTFAPCLPPNVTLADINLSYAIPDGFAQSEEALNDPTVVAMYDTKTDPLNTSTSTPGGSLIIRRIAISASSTALATIQQTAISGTSGSPVPVTAFSSSVIGTHRFTVVSIERFEGVIDTAYYLARAADVLRFDAIDREVINWMEPNLDVSKLPAHSALEDLLTTLQGW